MTVIVISSDSVPEGRTCEAGDWLSTSVSCMQIVMYGQAPHLVTLHSQPLQYNLLNIFPSPPVALCNLHHLLVQRWQVGGLHLPPLSALPRQADPL